MKSIENAGFKKKPTIVILGSTGLLGQALLLELKRSYSLSVVGVARKNADFCLDITKKNSLNRIFNKYNPDVIFNTVALTDLVHCELDLDFCYRTNAQVVYELARMSKKYGSILIQISTDHFYDNDDLCVHKEKHPVFLKNHYALSKYVAEKFALYHENSLVIRTNIVGFRGWKNPTFIEKILFSAKKNEPIELWEDYYVSSIDVISFSSVLAKLIFKIGIKKGVFNIASREVFSKKKFIEHLLQRFGFLKCKTVVVKKSDIEERSSLKRGSSLGLDVSKAEKVLGTHLPDLEEVINNIYEQGIERRWDK